MADSYLISQVVIDRATELSREPEHEQVIVLALDEGRLAWCVRRPIQAVAALRAADNGGGLESRFAVVAYVRLGILTTQLQGGDDAADEKSAEHR